MTSSERHVVAIVALGTSPELEAKSLAADLGTIAYEERLKLNGGLPAVVLVTTDEAAAQTLLAKLLARRHRALACRSSDVVRASAMIALRHFEMDREGLGAGTQRLPWADISALIHARHEDSTSSVEVVSEKKFNLGRALLTGGLVMRKAEKREVATRTDDTENVLYLFRTSGGTPWILRERHTNYSALGAALAPTAMHNFATAVEQFRARAPQARFDDSLVRRAVADIDLHAHLIAAGQSA